VRRVLPVHPLSASCGAWLGPRGAPGLLCRLHSDSQRCAIHSCRRPLPCSCCPPPAALVLLCSLQVQQWRGCPSVHFRHLDVLLFGCLVGMVAAVRVVCACALRPFLTLPEQLSNQIQ